MFKSHRPHLEIVSFTGHLASSADLSVMQQAFWNTLPIQNPETQTCYMPVLKFKMAICCNNFDNNCSVKTQPTSVPNTHYPFIKRKKPRGWGLGNEIKSCTISSLNGVWIYELSEANKNNNQITFSKKRKNWQKWRQCSQHTKILPQCNYWCQIRLLRVHSTEHNKNGFSAIMQHIWL